MEEIEVKFLGINPEAIEEKLIKIGAKFNFDKIYQRIIFDYPDLRLNAQGAYLRLRDEGEKVTLAFKKRLGIKGGEDGQSDEAMEEIEVGVSDFESARQILLRLGFIEKLHQENRRRQWLLDGVEFDLEFWPLLEPYLEIEGLSYEQVDEAIKLLDLSPKDKKIFTNWQIYEAKGINLLDYQKITFAEQIYHS